MSKQSCDNDVLLSKRNDEAFTRQQRKSNKGGFHNRNNSSNYVNGNVNVKNFGIQDGKDEIFNKSKQNGVQTDNLEKISSIKQQILSKNKSSLLIEKDQIDDENARGFDHVFLPNVSKLSSSRQRDYENSLSSRGDSKFTVKSEQSSLLFQSNPNQNNSQSINNTANINNKILQQSSHHHLLSNNNIHNELENKSSKVANLNSQFDKSTSLRSNQTQQLNQQGSINQNFLLNQLNQNSHNIHFSTPLNNVIRSQLSLNFNEADSINQYLKQEQSNNIDLSHLNGLNNQFQSQEQIQLLQIQSIQQQKQQQPFINVISSQNANSNFNNDLIGGGSYGGLNSMNDFHLNSTPHNFNRNFLKNENTNSLGYNLNAQSKNNNLFDEDEEEGKGISYYWDIKEENEDNNSTLLGANLIQKLGQKALLNHKNNCSSPNNQNSYGYNNFGLKKSQIKQESLLSTNPNDQTNLNDQARSQNDDNSNNGDQDGENRTTLRGLRILSLKVKQIVQEKGSTTYKEVAETLVQNLKNGQQKQLEEQAELRDEQNIKRRVYDALNVLIASEVIAKKGKKVLAIPKTNLTGKCLKSQNWEEAKKQQEELDRQREKVNIKKQQVQEYARKYLALKNLIQRNQNSEKNTQLNSQFFENFINKKEDYEENQKLFISSQLSNNNGQSQNLKENVLQTQIDLSTNKFQFPLITLAFNPDDQSRVILKMNKEKTNLKIYAKGYLQTLGDLDIICKMNMDQVTESFKQDVLGEKYLQWVNSLDQVKREDKISNLLIHQYDNNHSYMLNEQSNY